mmetsp:Transcript_11668/g.18987  ORF Transcript_11668/g.18987 Transcript_11668/m.18987 type:complete len:285 (+) Transcript_11668:69-923(+)
MSSILRIIRTVSEAREIALVETRSGWKMFSSARSVIFPVRTLIPAVAHPSACWRRSSVTILIGFKPAFSAKVYGTTSKASAKALTQNWDCPLRVFAYWDRRRASSASGAPPPTMRNLFLTKQRTTHKASCNDRSASPRTNLFDPRQRTVTVLPLFGQPVTLITLPDPRDTSSTSFAWPSFSGRKLSTWATGRHPTVRLMNSISVRSTSLMTMIFIFARKWRERSFVASRKIDFCTSKTLQPESLIFLHNFNMYLRSSRRIRSIAAYSETTTLFSMSVFGAERQN